MTKFHYVYVLQSLSHPKEIYTGITANLKQRLAEISKHSPAYHAVTAKAFSGNSKAAGIKAKCLDCCCWQRIEITNCTTLACPLWPYRPYQPGDSEQEPALLPG